MGQVERQLESRQGRPAMISLGWGRWGRLGQENQLPHTRARARAPVSLIVLTCPSLPHPVG